MRGAVFVYHSQNCGGYDYCDNDHRAFEQDLRAIDEYGLPIISLAEIATKIASGRTAQLPQHFVGLSCDDGSLLDWHDYQHRVFGAQRSFANILREHIADRSIQGEKLLTAFVIASPAAREAIDAGCYGGNPLSDDGWWQDAAREGLLAIENHSWDHVHSVLPAKMLRHGLAGDFFSVDNYEKADVQIRLAAEFIDQMLVESCHKTSLFAYPYGHAGAYLSDVYLPRYQQEHGMIAAFTTEQNFIDDTSRLYALPRLVCGDAWRTPEQFNNLLERLIEA